MAVMNTLTLPDAPAAVATNEGSIFFIGNATVLIRVAGFTILTDPTFIHKHEQTWLGGGLHTTRLTDPAIELADLPPLDLVLLSHFHGDHFDQVAERDLDRTLPIVTTPQSANDLEERGFTNCIPLDVWESVNVEKGSARLLITATPARHGPPLVDFVLPDVMGSVLDVTGDPAALPRHRHRPAAPRRNAGAGDPGQHGREAGRGSDADRRSCSRHPDPLQRLRRLHLLALGFPGRGARRGTRSPSPLPEPRRDVHVLRGCRCAQGVPASPQGEKGVASLKGERRERGFFSALRLLAFSTTLFLAVLPSCRLAVLPSCRLRRFRRSASPDDGP
ncbi:MAG: putative metal-dependent hydrolase [Thermomicrobiales bacterium]|nr:putative metal-dependent hydrolase [Thermomicrobiales bacterium]